MPRPPGPPPIFVLANPAKFGGDLRGAGFSRAHVDEVTHVWEIAGFDEFWDRFSVADALRRIIQDRYGDALP